MNAGDALRATELIAGAGAAISSLELLVAHRTLAGGGEISWEVGRLVDRTRAGAIGRALDPLFSYPGVLALPAARLIAALCTMIAPSPLAAAVVAVTTLLMIFRAGWSMDAAVQLAVPTFTALALARAVPSSPAPLAFIALTSLASYATAGLTKIGVSTWRDGTALRQLLANDMFGDAKLAALFDAHPIFARWSCRAFLALECALPFALITPAPITWALLAAGAVFHLAVAVTMGLGNFFWAFAATYPAILWLNAAL